MSNKSKHTPGPWTFERRKERGFWVNIGPAHRPDDRLSIGYPGGSPPQVEKDEANAKLIAAGPELLHACELAKLELEKMGCSCDCEDSPVYCPVCAINAAIAKATA